MCLELIEYITLDAYVEGQPREIYIYYKLLDEPLKDKRSLFKGKTTTLSVYSHMFQEYQVKACDAVANALKFNSGS